MRVLITGVSGFAGSHLAAHLLAQGEVDLWGTARSGLGASAHLAGRITTEPVDLIEAGAVRALLERAQPERIYHLAAQAFVPRSWEAPWETLENNIRGQLNVLQGVVDLGLESRVLCVASMEVYGPPRPEELPLDERTPFRPDSPYGVSKVAQDVLGGQYFQSYGVHAVRARPFNHIGPRQNDRFVAASFARQIAEIEAGLRPPVIEVGNLEAQRDFTDVRDVVRAYVLLLEQGVAGEAYNIGRGDPVRIRYLLNKLLSFSHTEIEVRQDPARLRPSDVPLSCADISKIQAATGWRPEIPLHQSLRDILNDWRQRVAAEQRTRQNDGPTRVSEE